jgi:hypothetical protein
VLLLLIPSPTGPLCPRQVELLARQTKGLLRQMCH